MQKITSSLLLILITAFVLPTNFAEANEISIRPFLIDETAGPRDIIEETVVLNNDGNSLRYIYATVNEISVDQEGEIKKFVSPVMTDRTNTITSWIEVTRGRIELAPKERKEISLTIRINPFVQPGEYHAFVGFGHAQNRPTAESNAMNGDVDGVIVKITINDQRTEGLRLSRFSIDRFITNENQRAVEVIIENTGEIADSPQGEIIFYDSQGREIDAVEFNTEGVQINPGETKTIMTNVPLDRDIGRFKANLSLDYGIKQKASLFDSTSFYLLPLNLLLLIFGIILVGAIFVTLLFRKAFLAHDYEDEDGEQVTMYVKEGHEANPKDHDIDLKKKQD
jgi:hypothetical protein